MATVTCLSCNGNGGHSRVTSNKLGVKQTEWIKCTTCKGTGTVKEK